MSAATLRDDTVVRDGVRPAPTRRPPKQQGRMNPPPVTPPGPPAAWPSRDDVAAHGRAGRISAYVDATCS